MSPARDEVFWSAGACPRATPLEGDLVVDAVVVGGGVAGLSCARFLAEQGLTVALLERSFCGSGASGKSSGFITPDSEMQLSDLLAKFGPERGAALWRLVERGVEIIRDSVAGMGLDCDLRIQDSLLAGVDVRGAHHVAQEHEARRRLGYESRHYRERDVAEVLGSRRYTAAVRYPGTFGIDAFSYCRGLRDALVAPDRGVAIHEGTPVDRILVDGVQAGAHRVTAKHVVVCTDRFIPELGLLREQIDHVQTFLAVSQPLPRSTLEGLFPAGPLMVWDTKVVYHYFRVVRGDRLLVGGADLLQTYARHERHGADANARPLDEYVRETFPDLRLEWAYVWPGMLGVSKDLLPLAGRDRSCPSIHYVGAVTGLPWAATLARCVAETIAQGVDAVPPELSPYRRFALGSGWNDVLSKPVAFAVSHGLQKVRQKYF